MLKCSNLRLLFSVPLLSAFSVTDAFLEYLHLCFHIEVEEQS